MSVSLAEVAYAPHGDKCPETNLHIFGGGRALSWPGVRNVPEHEARNVFRERSEHDAERSEALPARCRRAKIFRAWLEHLDFR